MALRTRGSRFDWVELLLAASLVGVLAWVAGRTAASGRVNFSDYLTQGEYARLAATYGPQKNSEYEEEWIVRDYFKDRRGGTFLDVGANHYKFGSNTYYLESHLGWSGIAVDPLADLGAEYAKHRSRTRFFPFFVSDRSSEKVKFFIARNNPLVASARRAFTESFGTRADQVEVETITASDLLDSAGVASLDFVSIDVELAEPQVLAGFDIQRFRPQLVCIEAHPEVRQQILDYFAGHGYVAVGKYLRVDTQNLYFKPLAGSDRR